MVFYFFLRSPPTILVDELFFKYFTYIFFLVWVSRFMTVVFFLSFAINFQLVKKRKKTVFFLGKKVLFNVHHNYEPWNPKPHVRFPQPLFVITTALLKRFSQESCYGFVEKKQIFTLKWLSGRFFCVYVELFSWWSQRFIEKGNKQKNWLECIRLVFNLLRTTH